ncbi:MAG: femAB family protein [Spirochaetia bacterium]|nr:femAB family protein [Spirochaetia bacterium]
MRFEKIDLLKDIYYSSQYSNLYSNDNVEIHRYFLQNNNDIVLDIGVKKPIETIGRIKLNEIYYDVETTYGYGGFFSVSHENSLREKLFNQYVEYCKERKIIAEFFRFHPLNNFPQTNSGLFDFVTLDREVVYVDLIKNTEERWADYSSTTRNILRKCRKDLKIELSDNIQQFKKMYYETMDRNQASDFYYFKEDYFNMLLKINGVYLLSVSYESKVIAMAFIMLGQDIGHYHLSANKTNYIKLNANYLILDEAFELGKAKGMKIFMLGGGRTNQPDDSLLNFKKKFSKLTLPYYIGGKIFLPEVFSEYNRLWREQSVTDAKYFLKYRLPL